MREREREREREGGERERDGCCIALFMYHHHCYTMYSLSTCNFDGFTFSLEVIGETLPGWVIKTELLPIHN